MKIDHIDICGLTPQNKLPRCTSEYPFKEICSTHKLCVPACKPDIENILQLFLTTSIEKCNILYNECRDKLLVYGNIHIKILYDANTASQSVHSTHFNIPFCTFVKLRNNPRDITDVSIFIEDAFIHQTDLKNFSISLLMVVCPTIKIQNNCCKNNIDYVPKINNENLNYIKPLTSSDNGSDYTKNNKQSSDYNDSYTDSFDDENELEIDIEYDMNSNNKLENNFMQDEFFEEL